VEERGAWQRFWSDVRKTLETARRTVGADAKGAKKP
jgi:hypothetical protein